MKRAYRTSLTWFSDPLGWRGGRRYMSLIPRISQRVLRKLDGESNQLNEKKHMANLQKARNAPHHRYENTPYRDRADELHKAFRKYMLR